MIVGDTFESESVVELDAQSAQERPADGRVASADEQLRGALVDPASIEQLAREVTPGPLEGPMLSKAVERVRGSIELRPKGERRYGVVFRRLLERESLRVSWFELSRFYRRLEARGEIRGGYFVSGVSGDSTHAATHAAFASSAMRRAARTTRSEVGPVPMHARMRGTRPS